MTTEEDELSTLKIYAYQRGHWFWRKVNANKIVEGYAVTPAPTRQEAIARAEDACHVKLPQRSPLDTEFIAGRGGRKIKILIEGKPRSERR